MGKGASEDLVRAQDLKTGCLNGAGNGVSGKDEDEDRGGKRVGGDGQNVSCSMVEQLQTLVHNKPHCNDQDGLILNLVGGKKAFQKVLYLICAFQNISCGIHYLASVFMGVAPYHVCRPPGNVSQVVFHNHSNWSLEDFGALLSSGHKDYVAVQLQNGEIWELSRCSRSKRENITSLDYEYTGSKKEFPCVDGYIYDQNKWKSTAVTQWNLVCDRKWLAMLIQPLFMFGVLLGSLTFGYFSDSMFKDKQIEAPLEAPGIDLCIHKHKYKHIKHFRRLELREGRVTYYGLKKEARPEIPRQKSTISLNTAVLAGAGGLARAVITLVNRASLTGKRIQQRAQVWKREDRFSPLFPQSQVKGYCGNNSE
ncbi:hypothetical protein P7K49_008460 [Saguinus oedipus]|uniref:Uncharacterized protein n=1 Tax=Saguinus oedipus TaxID=9490 RepID=A0ABQ9VXS7_SAGOE|nr:hypothetical protein P7K49_008460 [Saguinus oedipus]